MTTGPDWEDVIKAENEKAKLGGQPPTTRASIPPHRRKKDPKRVAAGKRARSSGARMEREAIQELAALGVQIEKLPVSGRGRARGRGGDAHVEGLGRVEIKGRAGGFRTIYRWLGDYFGLIVRAKAEPGQAKPDWLAVIRAKDLGRIIQLAQLPEEIRELVQVHDATPDDVVTYIEERTP